MRESAPKPKRLGIMLRRCRRVIVQNKIGYLVEGKIEKNRKDFEKLKNAGLHVYGVRSNVGIPWVLEEDIHEENHYGYIVMKAEMVFPVRKTVNQETLSENFYGLNNQYSKIFNEYNPVNLLNESVYSF